MFWSPPGIEPRTACLKHKCSATELKQLASTAVPLNSINTELECLFAGWLLYIASCSITNLPNCGPNIFNSLYCLKMPVKEREYI